MAAEKLRCKECGAEYPLEALLRLRALLRPARGRLRPRATRRRRRRCGGGSRRGRGDIWRYADFLPLAGGPPGPSNHLASRAGLPAGWTPLISADRLAERLGLREVWVKNDAANPTHSFKDRVVAVASARARELGFEALACASTGNLGNAVAAAGGGARPALLRLHPRRPRGAEDPRAPASTARTSSSVRGNYDDVNRLCTEVSAEHEDWAFVNINMRPYYSEGSKTVAFEIVEQLGWELPDRCIVPVASGSLFTKIHRGFAGVARARARRAAASRR